MSKNAPGCLLPVRTWCVATRWLFSRCDSERTTEYIRDRTASFGRCSDASRPGVFVWMCLYSPRISGGASGFGSNVSMWLAAPVRKTISTDFGLLLSES